MPIDDAPDAVLNEAVIRLASYQLRPVRTPAAGIMYADALRSSGAAMILLPYKVIRAGSTGEAVAAAQAAVGTTGNPVTDVTVDATAGTITVTFADGTTRTDNLPAGMGGGGADQTARDAAAQAQSDIDAHELTPHNTDTVARSTARNARTTAERAQATADAVRTELTTHETTPHGGGGGADQTARDAAAAAQGTADGAASTAASNAAAIAALPTPGPGYTDTEADARVRALTENWAEVGNGERIPAPKLTLAVDQGARTGAANAQSAIEAHERTTHNTDLPARAAAAAAQADIDDHEANHPSGGLTAAQAARLLPTHTASQDGFIATSTDVADQWALSPRRVPNPILADRG